MWIAGRSAVFHSICIERHRSSDCVRVFDDAQMAVVGRGTRSERFPGTRTTLLFTLTDAHVETRTRALDMAWAGSRRSQRRGMQGRRRAGTITRYTRHS